jgi:hypothetical protein
MTEKLLQFIWRFRYFNQSDLRLETGEALLIIYPGQPNPNQGPDFLNAKIKIGLTTWAGHIELHLQSSDWKKHAHSEDKNYQNVILHVVLENDLPVETGQIPMLVLQHRIPNLLLDKYEEWMRSMAFISCEKNIRQVNDIAWFAWKQRLLIERLERKSILIMEYLQQSLSNWQEIFWWLIAGNFGMKVNTAAFEAIARTLPLKMLTRHKNNILQLEALLFGQAGLLDTQFEEDYARMLKKEYLYLKNKYHIRPAYEPVHFLRMRPGNFPTVRLAQLAQLVHRSSHMFSRVKETQSLKEVMESLEVTANDYWHYHYRLDEPTAFRMKPVGKQMVENIIINTIVPVLFTYGILHKDHAIKNKALRWLEETVSEKNSILQQWTNIGIESKTATDSQALLELKSMYCDKKRCLECAVGNALLKGFS